MKWEDGRACCSRGRVAVPGHEVEQHSTQRPIWRSGINFEAAKVGPAGPRSTRSEHAGSETGQCKVSGSAQRRGRPLGSGRAKSPQQAFSPLEAVWQLDADCPESAAWMERVPAQLVEHVVAHHEVAPPLPLVQSVVVRRENLCSAHAGREAGLAAQKRLKTKCVDIEMQPFEARR
eukprot:6175545-Pleurochrysis_carterae.AAC.1